MSHITKKHMSQDGSAPFRDTREETSGVPGAANSRLSENSEHSGSSLSRQKAGGSSSRPGEEHNSGFSGGSAGSSRSSAYASSSLNRLKDSGGNLGSNLSSSGRSVKSAAIRDPNLSSVLSFEEGNFSQILRTVPEGDEIDIQEVARQNKKNREQRKKEKAADRKSSSGLRSSPSKSTIGAGGSRSTIGEQTFDRFEQILEESRATEEECPAASLYSQVLSDAHENDEEEGGGQTKNGTKPSVTDGEPHVETVSTSASSGLHHSDTKDTDLESAAENREKARDVKRGNSFLSERPSAGKLATRKTISGTNLTDERSMSGVTIAPLDGSGNGGSPLLPGRPPGRVPGRRQTVAGAASREGAGLGMDFQEEGLLDSRGDVVPESERSPRRAHCRHRRGGGKGSIFRSIAKSIRLKPISGQSNYQGGYQFGKNDAGTHQNDSG